MICETKEGEYQVGKRSDGQMGAHGLLAFTASAFLNAKLRVNCLMAFSRGRRFLS